jgi:hypothetical protein
MPRKGKRVPVAQPVSPSVAAWRQRHPSLAQTEAALAKAHTQMREDWKHKNDGTPETHEHASKTRQGALARLFESGAINADQLAWANEIAMVAETLQRDVAPRIVEYEPRIDHETRGPTVLIEGVMRVRREMAYKEWCRLLPNPKPLVLSMVTGEAIGYTVAARRYHVHQRNARRELIKALDRWPELMDWACSRVDREDLVIAHARLA